MGLSGQGALQRLRTGAGWVSAPPQIEWGAAEWTVSVLQRVGPVLDSEGRRCVLSVVLVDI